MASSRSVHQPIGIQLPAMAYPEVKVVSPSLSSLDSVDNGGATLNGECAVYTLISICKCVCSNYNSHTPVRFVLLRDCSQISITSQLQGIIQYIRWSPKQIRASPTRYAHSWTWRRRRRVETWTIGSSQHRRVHEDRAATVLQHTQLQDIQKAAQLLRIRSREVVCSVRNDNHCSLGQSRVGWYWWWYDHECTQVETSWAKWGLQDPWGKTCEEKWSGVLSGGGWNRWKDSPRQSNSKSVCQSLSYRAYNGTLPLWTTASSTFSLYIFTNVRLLSACVSSRSNVNSYDLQHWRGCCQATPMPIPSYRLNCLLLCNYITHLPCVISPVPIHHDTSAHVDDWVEW